MTTGIAHIAVSVKDMEKSLDFYTNALGFRKAFNIDKPQDSSPWIVYLYIAEGQFMELFYGGEKLNPWDWQTMGFNHLCFAVDDIHTAAKQITDAGYVLTDEPKQGSDGNWQCWTTDPDGVRIELMQLSPDSLQAQTNKRFN